MDTPVVPVKRLQFRLSYPCAALATVIIVGGAPPAAPGLTGCAAPPVQSPVGAALPSPPATGSVIAAPHAPLALAASPAGGPVPREAPASSPDTAAPALPLGEPPSAPLGEPTAAPHTWKGGELQRALTQLAQWAKKNGGTLGAELDDVSSGTVIASVSASLPQNPASNQKILTTAAVLHHFGAEYRFKTSICGTRSGDSVPRLVLRGSGDPSLSSADLQELARALVQAGLKHVGDLLLDQSFFDAHYVPPGFEQQPNEWAAFRAPVSAASLNRNAITLNVTPGEPGQAAHVWFEPDGFVDVMGTVRTDALRDTRRGGKMERTQNVKLTLKESGTRLAALVAGDIQPNSATFHWSRRVEDPTLLAGFELKAALAAQGIQVSGKIGAGGESEQAELAAHQSLPLREILPELGKDSDNFYAETLLKDLGAKLKGAPGTSANGASAVLDYLREIEALDPGTKITNGSGLFDANRISAHTLVKTLRSAYRDPAMSEVFVAQLAVGGVDGTLKHRFSAFKKQRSIHAKTGTLDDVIALSGYAARPDGSSPVAFSLILTGIAGKHADVRKRIDDIVSSVARTLARDDASSG